MADYGGYQIKRTVAQGPFTTVHEAVAAGGGEGRFALKIFHPPPSTAVRRLLAVEGWLLAAERQKLAAKKDGAVVEVLACGRCEEGAFAVLPWQERTLEPFIKILGVKGDTLRALADCVFTAIEKWEEQTGGPHGNLKPSNLFPARGGLLAGMPLKLSDAAHVPGAKPEERRLADRAAVGAMLATIVRRRPPGAWPIEDAPEWRALGKPGKAWLDFCNDLLNPSPDGGPMPLADARKKLRAVPKDSNPAKIAVLTLAAVLALGAVGTVAFARFGNPIYMPDQLYRLAVKVGNKQIKPEVPQAWVNLCRAWDTWLIDLQSNGQRMVRTEELWAQDDQLRREITDFLAQASNLHPTGLVPLAAGEKRLGVLATSPSEAILNEISAPDNRVRIDEAGRQLLRLSTRLENWDRWGQLRELRQLMEQRGFARASSALESRLPPARSTPGYKLDLPRTLKFLNDLSLDREGALPLTGRWSEIAQLKADMEASGDRVQQAMPAIITGRLVDKGSLADFADSLTPPLEEMRQRRRQFLDPQVVSARFLKESPLQAETAAVTEADFSRWEQELVAFSKVPQADDPRLVNTFEASVQRMQAQSSDLEADAPAAEPEGPPTLSTADFTREFQEHRNELQTFRNREVVRRDLPAIAEETTKLGEKFAYLERRIEATLALLKPEIWLAKVANAYGKFAETKQRWAAWQATLATATADALRADRPRFRALRAQERQTKEWIDGVEGPAGFAALAVPDLSGASADASAELLRLESARREQAVSAVAAAAEWRNAVPAVAWASAGAATRAPLEAHKAWLAGLVQFASILDQLNELLTAGFEWGEGVSEVVAALARQGGVGDLAGRPAEWHAEAKQLEPLVNSADRAALTAAAQAGGLSRKLMAWRRLGGVDGWPGGAEDFDFDTGVVTLLRETVGRDVRDERRKTALLDEMAAQTRARFNRAARRAAVAEASLTAMFDRLAPAGLAVGDLEEPVAYNHALWTLKRSDWNQNLEVLRVRRDEFVDRVRGLAGVASQADISRLIGELSGIELKDDPNRKPTPSPRLVPGWQEELTNEGLAMTATWTGPSGKKVSIDYIIVQPQPPDTTPPFYLAKRAIAVGEFVDLINSRSAEANAVLAELPDWQRVRPYNKPVSWERVARGVAMTDKWIYQADSQVQGLIDNEEAALKQASKDEKPTARSPIQQIPPPAAKMFAERVLGARLPKPQEWRAVTKLAGRPQAGFFRGASFEKLWSFVVNYNVGGQSLKWRPNAGIYSKSKVIEDGKPASLPDSGRLWLASVDEGPQSEGFVNLYGNVWILLEDSTKTNTFFVAGGSALSHPGIDIVEPQALEASGLIGSTRAAAISDPYSDVGIRPAFDAPPGFRERYKFLVLVRGQKYLTL
jgi:hypothetical protein